MKRRLIEVVVLAIWIAVLSESLGAQIREEPKEDVSAREEYFWSQRSYPSTVRPYEQMQRVHLQMAEQHQARFNMSLLTGGTGGWRSLGPTGLFDNGTQTSGPMLDAGRVTSVVPSPTGGSLYIGTASGGVWRSSNGGSWSPLTDTQCNLTIGAMTIDPADPNTIYATTGELNVGSWGCGILRSTDGGTNWTLLNDNSFRVTSNGQPYGSAFFGKIIVSRPTGGSLSQSVLIGASIVGVYRSPDGGATWSRVLPGTTSSVVARPTDPTTVFVGNYDFRDATRRGLYRSVDNGATWTLLPALPDVPTGQIGRIELSVTPAAPNLVFALIADNSGGLIGMFVWDDVAGSWNKPAAVGLNRGAFGGQSFYNLAIAVDPRSASRIFVAGVRAFRSTDGGSTFSEMGHEIHVDWHSIAFDPQNPDIIYAGTDGGVFLSADQGVNWVSRNSGLTVTQYYPGISASPNGAIIMGGSQDNGTLFFTGSTFWNGFLSGDGGYSAISYDNPAIRYAEAQWGIFGAFLVRFDGTSFSVRTSGLDAGDRAAFIPPYVMDPATSTTLYFGTHRLYRTVNEGVNWVPISGDLTKGSGYITTIAVSKSNPQTIYVGASDGMVNVTRNAGTTFTQINAGLPNRWISDIEVDPADATHALVSVSGFGTGHVFETRNAGATWNDISLGLVDAPANAVAFVPGVGVIVGTDVGVFQTPSPGATWSNGPPGIPNVIVYDLIYVAAANTVIAGTYGRGMFAYTIGGETPVLRGDVNGDGTVDAFDALLIQQSLVGSLPVATVIYPRGDADCNQTIQTADAVFVLRAAVGLASPGVCVSTVK